jgi:hypothetical protein
MSEAEKYSLLETVAREQLVKAQKAGKTYQLLW